MTTDNPASLRAAHQRVQAFWAESRATRSGDGASNLQDRQRSPVGWPVTRDALVSQLQRRLQGDQQPRQLETSYCGPAAFLYCLLEDTPDVYVDYAIHLWKYGEYDFGMVDVAANQATIRSLGRINALRQQPRAVQHISSLDWMTLASLSASTRPWFIGSHGAEPDDVARSITYPWVLKRWFESIGAQCGYSCMGLGLAKARLSQFVELMRFWGRCWIVLQIDSSLIQGGNPDTLHNRHWVVVDPHHQPAIRRGDGRQVPLGSIGDRFTRIRNPRMPLEVHDPAMDGWTMDLKLVTWGQENYPIRMATLGDVPSRFYGGYAFPRQH